MKVYTLGYQGIDITTYVSILKSSRVGVVLDVREKAWSRKRGFSKSALQRALSAAGIEYIHIPSAGNPSENRKSAKNVADCLQRYRQLLRYNPDCLDELLTHIKRAARASRPACLTCYEQLPDQCHRSVIIETLVESAPKLKAVHVSLKMTKP
jgi:uncharacterized protein (DUF488 family)